MICKRCGAESPEGSKICMMCGEPFSGTKHCPKCGAVIEPGAVFCTQCGQKVSVSTSGSASPGKSEKPCSKNTVRNILIAAVIVVVVFVFLGGICKDDKSNEREKDRQKDAVLNDTYTSSDFSKAPSIIYTTTADENGYGETLMYVEGRVGEPFKAKGQNACEISTEEGEITVLSVPLLTPADEWEKLEAGEWVRVNFMYLGYSDVFDEASGTLISIEDAKSTPKLKSTAVSGTPVKNDIDEEDNGS